MESFGDQTLAIDQEWPPTETLNDFPLNAQIKLQSINYKRKNENNPLTGIQLVFTSEVSSALFETKFARENNKTEQIQIDTTKTIRKVAMFVTSN